MTHCSVRREGRSGDVGRSGIEDAPSARARGVV